MTNMTDRTNINCMLITTFFILTAFHIGWIWRGRSETISAHHRDDHTNRTADCWVQQERARFRRTNYKYPKWWLPTVCHREEHKLMKFFPLYREDQITLLKACSSEVMMLRCSRKYDYKTDSIVYANNQPYTRLDSSFLFISCFDSVLVQFFLSSY